MKDEGDPELVKAVEKGIVSVSAAADIVTLPKQAQTEIVACGERQLLEAAKQIRAKSAAKRRDSPRFLEAIKACAPA